VSGTPARHVLILGATGSIGRQALEVLATMPQLTLAGLAAGSNAADLCELALAHGARRVALRDERVAAEAAARRPELAVFAGEAGVGELIGSAAAEAAAAGRRLMVLNGVVGAAGLRATMATLEAGADLALANKESMVAGGPFVLDAAQRHGALILPVDSEHSALFQCLAAGGEGAEVEELLLTGSGGPFRGGTAADLAAATPERALRHPNWSMGPKITIDSATLMNKGLEVIEAHYLFGLPYERITVLLNPQSIVHSMVRFADGAILAHLGVPDMRTPIGYALAYPGRPALSMVRRLDLLAAGLTFEAPDTQLFSCLSLAQEAGRKAAAVEREADAAGGAPRTVAAPIVLNAANEVAVAAFLDGRMGFLDIAAVVEKCLTRLGDEPVESIDDVYACDAEARRFAAEAIGRPRA
jgi:1-deoxy-D-xylulose-5-phosphate reductoisomerase